MKKLTWLHCFPTIYWKQMFSSVRFKNTDFHWVHYSTKAVIHCPPLNYSSSQPLTCKTQTCLWKLSADWFLALHKRAIVWMRTLAVTKHQQHPRSSLSMARCCSRFLVSILEGIELVDSITGHLLVCGRKRNHRFSCRAKTYCLLRHYSVTGDWSQHH